MQKKEEFKVAVNPMQRKARNSFLLGVLLTLLITGIVITLLFLQLKKMNDEKVAEAALKVNVYVLNKDEEETTNILSAYKENGLYIIYKNVNNSKKICAKIKWNFFSNNFKIFNEKELLGEIIYNFNFKGWSGPTKLRILIPDDNFMNKNNKHKMENKLPEYNELYKSYVLDFANRKIIPNEKNIQIIFSGEDKNNILLQFAQVGNEEYILDFKYPFNKVTAFAVALVELSSRTFFQ